MGRVIAIVAVLFLALLLIGKCGGSEQPSQPLLDDGLGNPVAVDDGTGTRATADDGTVKASPPAAEGEPISVPSDPRASYRLLSWTRVANGNLQAVTRREGPSGTSYARREIDCGAMTFRYLGEGDSLEEALADAPNPGPMGELTSQSISTYVSEFVCRKGAG